jgi:hypothetical protein
VSRMSCDREPTLRRAAAACIVVLYFPVNSIIIVSHFTLAAERAISASRVHVVASSSAGSFSLILISRKRSEPFILG